MIETQGLHKRFGKTVAVEEVSFTARDGGVTALLGPNGAGKTTSLRMLYGLLQPDAGRALVDGHEAATDPLATQRRLGVLPDSTGLYGRLTAREQLRYAARLQGLSSREAEERAAWLIDRLDMRGITDRPSAGFSQGERRKVALGRALIHDPRNVVLDEPTNGLDVPSTRAMRRFVRELADSGRCVLFSTHILQEVSAVCDRVVVIARGRVAAEGTPAELVERTGEANLEDAFVRLIGTEEGLGA
ncbi:MAG TPA: ATP-binding cassette domain-containing protein [Thermoanaerobaculia bacterium]|nr:ATP-binding cassette domain-containing protein [Thermoanaerobaculia bacterium]